MCAIIVIALGLIAILSLYWGTVLSLRLPDMDEWFDRKPFNCRPCLTFHLTWVLSALSAICLTSTALFCWGIVLAFALFLITKYIDNKKIKK